ncbi:MAG: terpene cyclase/mutase family protein [Verrucomicrobiota bacterium JB023]|nr:terpene cyclase/mutase family protein [Verrucomicrobiota bacterium JB023]
MKTTAILFALLGSALLSAQEVQPAEAANRYLSVKHEARLAMSSGVDYLKSQQQDEGHWGKAELPAFTALALTAALRDPGYDHSQETPEWIEKGFDYLRAKQQEDGGIYETGLATYNTSTSIMAFLALGKEEDESRILKARAFLIGQQTDWGNKGETDDQFDGGIGYGGSYDHSDLSNTYMALEAIYHSRELAEDSANGNQPKLNWDAALTFISRCQNLTETNDLDYASDDADNKGGFIYFPGQSKAGEQEIGDDRVALRSYGSMSYAGLLSLIYAELPKDDPRLVAVMDWLGRNFTLEENPGMGLQGLYYYYQAIAKSLSAAGVEMLELEGDKTVDWRKELATTILTKQREDGSWANENSRWMENDPVLVTAYTVMALAQLDAVM